MNEVQQASSTISPTGFIEIRCQQGCARIFWSSRYVEIRCQGCARIFRSTLRFFLQCSVYYDVRGALELRVLDFKRKFHDTHNGASNDVALRTQTTLAENMAPDKTDRIRNIANDMMQV